MNSKFFSEFEFVKILMASLICKLEIKDVMVFRTPAVEHISVDLSF